MLVDQPFEERNKVRVTGRFTVESLSLHRVLDEERPPPTDTEVAAAADADSPTFEQTILDDLRKAGAHNTLEGEEIRFDRLDLYAGTWIQAEGEFTDADGESRVPTQVELLRAERCLGPNPWATTPPSSRSPQLRSSLGGDSGRPGATGRSRTRSSWRSTSGATDVRVSAAEASDAVAVVPVAAPAGLVAAKAHAAGFGRQARRHRRRSRCTSIGLSTSFNPSSRNSQAERSADRRQCRAARRRERGTGKLKPPPGSTTRWVLTLEDGVLKDDTPVAVPTVAVEQAIADHIDARLIGQAIVTARRGERGVIGFPARG